MVTWKNVKGRANSTYGVLMLFCKSLRDRDHLENLGLYGRRTLKWIFRFIQISNMTTGQKGGKTEPLKSLMNYSVSSTYGSKRVTNHSNVLTHSSITLLTLVP
jgi:hypothetical protein